MNYENNQLKRAKKPKPLFGLFRKTPAAVTSPTTNLGSGTTFLPLDSSILENSMRSNLGDPYSPPPIQPKPFSQYQNRQRSKSVGKEAYPNRLLEERELALNKLCKNEEASSLVDSLPLLSPNSYKSNNFSKLKKSSSTHDLRKATKLQQESINQLIDKTPLPLKPKNEKLSRSKSLNSSRRLKSSKSQQQLSNSFNDDSPPPLPLNAPQIMKYKSNKNDNDSDDDDIPLGYLQSPIEIKNRPSSLLSDRDDDDDADLIPIAIINHGNQENHSNTQDYQSAADKYKERVKERLRINTSDDDDDDDIPISTLLSPNSRNKNLKLY